MRVRIKLTSVCDLDLISLYNSPGFNFKDWARHVLKTYTGSGEIVRIPLPAAPDIICTQSVRISISFSEIKDASVVSWLDTLKNRLWSCAIKSVLRCSLTHPCLFAHYDNAPAPFLINPPKSYAGSTAEDAVPVFHKPVSAFASFPAPLPEEHLEGADDIWGMSLGEMEYIGGDQDG